MSTRPLRLKAESPDDVEILSAALQDAVGTLGDFYYEPKARRFTLAFNRFRWEAGDRGRGERVRAAVQIGGVLSAQSFRLKRNSPDAVVSLLAVTFEETESPGGALVFNFAGGGALRLDVECVDMALADVSEPWRARRRPAHPDV
ncbi:DUF2948 domain-containing protein [Marinicauda salina]|jgi:hypothetical protein|uniref:DUF2948 domain-containing protein n=1 Tax=Marinicauda salina TaxID=2135793 RepID=A0A2U2BTT3_9PROT|nr:DUF2948 family protein [Marinicauda salina]PWE17423.1 DUF2948 domain-containing protein [Marinicauda salina]